MTPEQIEAMEPDWTKALEAVEAERDALRARVAELESGHNRLKLWFFRDHSLQERAKFYKMAGLMSKDDNEQLMSHSLENIMFDAAFSSIGLERSLKYGDL